MVEYFSDQMAYLHVETPVATKEDAAAKLIRTRDEDGTLQAQLISSAVPFNVTDGRFNVRLLLLGSLGILMLAIAYVFVTRGRRQAASVPPEATG
ncbi:MAG: hypothetical protein MI861_02390 [Pirellulales bacterium]|nr:hypothetical protein [Pirellulales bacterium]